MDGEDSDPEGDTIATIETLTEFTELIENELEGKWWYRGIGDIESYRLRPSLYRHPACNDVVGLIEKEKNIVERFRQRSIPYISDSQSLDDPWNTLFLMQHYGVPTRLLDWTENPYIGLYFALDAAKKSEEEGNLKYVSDAGVWAVKPKDWNSEVLENIDNEKVLTPKDDIVKSGYRPGEGYQEISGSGPICLYGSHNSPRIVAQRGVFIMFGTSVLPMEEYYVEEGVDGECIKRIKVPKERVGYLKKKINDAGITHSAVFPDLSGLASEIKREFGYIG